MKTWKYLSILTLLLLAGGCNLGTPTEATGGGTGVEGLTGALVTPSGAPAVGAHVRVYAVTTPAAPLAKAASAASAGDATADSAVATATASATGAFLFKDLADGTYNVAATFQSGDTTLSVFVRGVVVVGNTNLGTDTLRVSGGLSVQIRAGANALPGATCLIPASPWQAVSDSSGTCVLTGLPPDMFKIVVSYPGLVLFVSGDLTVTSGTVSSAGTFTLPGHIPAGESFRATISMNSSPPYPAFVLPDSARAMLNQSLQALCTPARLNDSAARFPNPFPEHPGYRGIHVSRAIGSDSSSQSISVYSGTVQIFDSNPPSVCAAAMQGVNQDVYLPDSARRVERLLLALARDAGVLTATQHDSIVASFGGTGGNQEPVDTVPPPAPNLVYPYTGALFVAPTPTFIWDSVPGATAYHFQMIGSNHVTIIIGEDSTLTVPSRVYGPLEYLVQYQWRVRARNAFGWGPWSAYATFMPDNMPVMPETPVLSSPAQNATGLSLTPTFVWSQLATAQAYHLQIHTDTSFINPRVSDTIQQPLSAGTLVSRAIGPLTGSTTYYWRVRAWNSLAAGTWSEVRRFTTTAAGADSLYSAPVLTLPSQNATGLSLTPTFGWIKVSTALGYHLQIHTDSAFINPVLSDTVPESAAAVPSMSRTAGPLAANTTYYWRVRAWNSLMTGAWSETRRFTTLLPDSPPPSGDTIPPATPTLVSPAAFSTNISTTPTLTWNAAATAVSYDVQVSTAANFASLAASDTGVTGTSKTLSPLTGNTAYYWRIRGRNAAGASAWSEVRQFTTGPGSVTPPVDTNSTAPNPPTLVAPAQFATNVSMTPPLTWNGIYNAASYDVQVSTSATFASFVVNDTAVTETSRTLAPLAASTVYYWRVRARNGAGASAYSEVYRFTTGSTTSSSWTIRNSGTTRTLWAATSSGTMFVTVGDTGTILTSPDGINWTARSSASSATFKAVTWTGTQFVAVGGGGTIVTSPNGITWTPKTSGATTALNGIAGNGALMVAVGANGAVRTSPDGNTWTARTSGVSVALYGIVWNGSTFVAVGGSGTILRSPDGISWTPQVAVTTNNLYGVAWNGSLFTAVGNNGAMLTSANGTTWTLTSSGTTQNLYAITHLEEGYGIAVGNIGAMTNTLSASTWSLVSSGTTTSLFGAATAQNIFAVVGAGGLILTQSVTVPL